MDEMVGIYKITNKINGHSYVGQSIDIHRRWKEHRCYHSRSYYDNVFARAMRKYGRDNFDYSVLEECEPEQLNEREIYWIDLLKPEYNMNNGGSGNYGHSMCDESRKAMSELKKKQWDVLPLEKKEEIIKRLTGQPVGHSVSAETREKLRQANLGKKQSAETIEKRKQTFAEKKRNGYKQTNSGHKKKVYCVETDQVYESLLDAARSLNIGATGICHVLHGRQENTFGYHFTFVV